MEAAEANSITTQEGSLESAGSGRADLGRLIAERASAGDVDLASRQDAESPSSAVAW